MALHQKTPGSFGGTRVASDGGDSYHRGAASRASRMYAHLSPSSSSVKDNRMADRSSLGDKPGTMAISTHNDINRFTSGISMHHPYKERGGAFGSTTKQWQASNEGRSRFSTPSGGGSKARAGQTMRETRSPAPYDDIMVENKVSPDATKHSPSGPKGGTRALMNRMKSAGVNKMGKSWK